MIVGIEELKLYQKMQSCNKRAQLHMPTVEAPLHAPDAILIIAFNFLHLKVATKTGR